MWQSGGRGNAPPSLCVVQGAGPEAFHERSHFRLGMGRSVARGSTEGGGKGASKALHALPPKRIRCRQLRVRKRWRRCSKPRPPQPLPARKATKSCHPRARVVTRVGCSGGSRCSAPLARCCRGWLLFRRRWSWWFLHLPAAKARPPRPGSAHMHSALALGGRGHTCGTRDATPDEALRGHCAGCGSSPATPGG